MSDEIVHHETNEHINGVNGNNHETHNLNGNTAAKIDVNVDAKLAGSLKVDVDIDTNVKLGGSLKANVDIADIKPEFNDDVLPTESQNFQPVKSN